MFQVEIIIFLRPVSPVVGMFVPRVDGDRENTKLTGYDEDISGKAFSHGAINTEIIFFSSLTGILLKTTDNIDVRNLRPGIKEKLGTKTDTVIYGLFRCVVKKLNGVFIIGFRRNGDQPAFRVPEVRGVR
ncbi:hypothetical protein CFSAN000599_26200 [Salmonella enterica subsp. enterica serovar Newport str. CFSAN000599]|nr:hypothetical protein [Salmonella enterica subsp. enterica serovar Newport str. CFSAN000599]